MQGCSFFHRIEPHLLLITLALALAVPPRLLYQYICSQSFQVALQWKDFYKINPGSSSQCLSCGQVPKDKFSTKSSQWSLLLQGQEFRGPPLPCELPGWGFCNEVIVKSWLTDDLPSAALGAGWGVLRKTLTLPVFLAAGWRLLQWLSWQAKL